MSWHEDPIEKGRGHLNVNDFEVKGFETAKEDKKYILGGKSVPSSFSYTHLH